MRRTQSVEDYISKKQEWQKELETLRSLILSGGLEEGVKWGAPVYMRNGKNVVGLGAFKEYVAIWFFQGALLKDEAGKLINAQEGKTQALRQWRFSGLDEIEKNRELIIAYVKEAAENAGKGKEIKPKRNAPVVLPAELTAAFEKQPALKESFDRLRRGKQREYAEYMSEAKRPETRQKRREKIVPMILEGVGLNDRYRKK